MTKVFLSGSRAVSRLDATIRERLDAIISGGFGVLVGDAAGADKAFQRHFTDAGYHHVRVFCAGTRCRNNLGAWETVHVTAPAGVKGRSFYTLKDRRMAEEADFGFVLWDGESAGSVNNLVMLVRQGKKAHLYLVREKRLRSVSSQEQIRLLLLADVPPKKRCANTISGDRCARRKQDLAASRIWPPDRPQRAGIAEQNIWGKIRISTPSIFLERVQT